MRDYTALAEALREWRRLCLTRYRPSMLDALLPRERHYNILRDYRAACYSREWGVFICCPELAPEVS